MYSLDTDTNKIKLTLAQWDKVYELFDKLSITRKDIEEDQFGNLKEMYIKRINEVIAGETQ